MITKEQIINALKTVKDPEIGKDLVTLNMIGDIAVKDGSVAINIKLTIKGCPMKRTIEDDIKAAVGALEGVKSVNITFGEMSPEEKQQLTASLKQGTKDKADVFKNINVIAVGSGKGGVGKSTVAVNLAVALQQKGMNTGILDADVLGFSVSTLLGIQGKKPVALDNQTIMPIQANNLKALSMGNLIKSDKALIWRAPVIRGVLDQFFYSVRWGDLDYLVIDLPPGTGDVPLTIMQQLPKAQLLLVTTPQSAAAQVSARLANMAQQMNISIMGVVENMSYFQCPQCDHKYYIFGQGQSEKIAAELNVELLAQIPLSIDIRENSDTGTPIALKGDDPSAAYYHDLAAKVINHTKKG